MPFLQASMGGGSSSLSDLNDVNITTPSGGDILIYDDTSNKWINSQGSSEVTVTLTINGAKEDSITIYDSNNTIISTCIFLSGETSGICTITIPKGYTLQYTFTSLITNYSKTTNISDAPSQTVNVYPDNYLFWHGNNIGKFKAYASPNFGSASISINTSAILLTYTGGGSGSIITTNKIDLSSINTITFVGTWSNANYYGVSILNSGNPTEQYIHSDAVKSNFYQQSLVLNVSDKTGSYYIACSCENSPSKTTTFNCTAIYLS